MCPQQQVRRAGQYVMLERSEASLPGWALTLFAEFILSVAEGLRVTIKRPWLHPPHGSDPHAYLLSYCAML